VKDLFKEQMNKIDLEVELGKNFQQITELREQGYTIPMAIFSLLKTKIEVSLNPELPEKLKETVGEVFKQKGMPVDMIV